MRKIYDGEIGYYQEEHTLSSGELTTKQFITVSATPTSVGRDKVLGNFDSEDWKSLKFSPDGPVWYSYSVDASGLGTAASFTARATGDLDGDGNTSLFERVGGVTPAGEVQGGSALYSLNEME